MKKNALGRFYKNLIITQIAQTKKTWLLIYGMGWCFYFFVKSTHYAYLDVGSYKTGGEASYK